MNGDQLKALLSEASNALMDMVYPSAYTPSLRPHLARVPQQAFLECTLCPADRRKRVSLNERRRGAIMHLIYHHFRDLRYIILSSPPSTEDTEAELIPIKRRRYKWLEGEPDQSYGSSLALNQSSSLYSAPMPPPNMKPEVPVLGPGTKVVSVYPSMQMVPGRLSAGAAQASGTPQAAARAAGGMRGPRPGAMPPVSFESGAEHRDAAAVGSEVEIQQPIEEQYEAPGEELVYGDQPWPDEAAA